MPQFEERRRRLSASKSLPPSCRYSSSRFECAVHQPREPLAKSITSDGISKCPNKKSPAKKGTFGSINAPLHALPTLHCLRRRQRLERGEPGHRWSALSKPLAPDWDSRPAETARVASASAAGQFANAAVPRDSVSAAPPRSHRCLSIAKLSAQHAGLQGRRSMSREFEENYLLGRHLLFATTQSGVRRSRNPHLIVHGGLHTA